MRRKDSGVQWLGKIPETWAVINPKRLFRLRKEREYPTDMHLTPSQKYGVLTQDEYVHASGSEVVRNLSGALMQHVEPGDFISHLRTFQGGLELSRIRGKVSSAYTVLSPNHGLDSEFYKHVFKSQAYISQIASVTQQLRDGQSMRYAEFSQTPLPVPPVNEQRKIAEFLDRETAEIDAFIADQSTFTTLLTERKDSLIEQTVKPESSQHPSWTPVRLSRVVRFCNGADYKEVEVDSPGYPVYGSGGQFRWADNWLYDGPSVLFGRKGTIDRPLYVEGKFWTVDTMYYTQIDESKILPKYLYYWATRFPFDYYATDTALPSMTQTDLGSESMVLPDLETQAASVRFLDQQTAEVEAILDAAKRAIELSKERRSALISAAVTGQIDVTDHYASEKVYEEAGLER